MENFSSDTIDDLAKKQYYYLEQTERRLRSKLRQATKAGDKQRADVLWDKTRFIIERRKGTVYYQQIVLPKKEQTAKLHT